MPNWKKVITSGSNAHLNHITASGDISSSGQLFIDNAKFGTDSVTIDGPNGHITASGGISASGQLIAASADFKDGSITNVGQISLDSLISDAGGDNIIQLDSTFIDNRINNTGVLKLSATSADFFNDGVTGHITASGNISSSETLIGKNISISNVSLDDTNDDATHYFTIFEDGKALESTNGITFNPSTDTLLLGGNSIYLTATGGHITASGNISSSGDLQSSKLTIVKKGASSNEKLISLTGGAGTERFSVDEDGDVVTEGVLTTGAIINGGDLIIGSNNNAGMGLGNQDSSTLRIHQADDEDVIYAEIGINGLKAHNHITASGDISASGGVLISSASIKTGLDRLVTYDTTTGQFHVTASSAFEASGVSSYDDLTNVPDGIFSSSLQTFTNITASGNISSSGEKSILGNIEVKKSIPSTNENEAATIFNKVQENGFALNEESVTFVHDGHSLFSMEGQNIDSLAIMSINGGDEGLTDTANYGVLNNFIFRIKGGTKAKISQASESFSSGFGTNDNDIIRIDKTFFSGSLVSFSNITDPLSKNEFGVSICATGSTLPTTEVNSSIFFVKTGSNTADYLNNVKNKINEISVLRNYSDRTLGLIANTGSNNDLQITHSNAGNTDTRFITGSSSNKFLPGTVGAGDGDFSLSGGTEKTLFEVDTIQDAVTVDGNITASGVISASEFIGSISQDALDGKLVGFTTPLAKLNVDNIEINGNTIDTTAGSLNLGSDSGVITINAGQFTVDASSDIHLDAGGGDIKFKDDGTTTIHFSTLDGHITASGGIDAGQTILSSSFPQLTLTDDKNDKIRIGQEADVGYFKTSDTNNRLIFRRSDNFDIIELDMPNKRVEFSGSIFFDANSKISASGEITASAFKGDGAGLTNVTATVTPAGSNTQVQFNDGGSLGGDSGFTFDKNTNSITAIHNITASGNISSSGTINSNILQVSAKNVAQYHSGQDTIILGNTNQKTNVRGADINFGDAPIFHEGAITASIISASGKLFALGGDFGDANIENVGNLSLDSLISDANANTEIQMASTQIDFNVDGAVPFFLNQEKVTIDSDASSFEVKTNITASGNISASGTSHKLSGITITNNTLTVPTNVATQEVNSSDHLVLDAAVTKDITFTTDGQGNDLGKINISGFFSNNHITASGNVSASGNIDTNIYKSNGANFAQYTGGVVNLGGGAGNPTTIGGTTIKLGANANQHITSSGNISSSGYVQTDTIYGSDNYLNFKNDTSNPSELRLYCQANSHYLGIRGPEHSGASSYVLKLPNDVPSDNQILKVSGTPSGTPEEVTLAWESDGGGGGGGVSFPTTDVISSSTDLFIGKTDGPFISGSEGNLELSGSGTVGQLEVDHRFFDTGSSTVNSAGGAIGDTIKFGDSSGLTAGKVYYLESDGTWDAVDADEGGKTSGSIAVATTAAATDGMVLRGVVKLSHDPGGAIGAPLFISTTPGQLTSTAPGSGDFVRIVGYNLDDSGLIFFNPGDTTIKVT